MQGLKISVLFYEDHSSPQFEAVNAIVARVKTVNPDVFFIPTYGNNTNLIATQAQQQGLAAALLGGDGWDSPDLDLASADGAYFCTHFSTLDLRPVVPSFVSRYRLRYNIVPDMGATLAYDAANVLLQSIQSTGADDPARVSDVMAASQFQAVSGDIAFDALHNPIKNAVILFISHGRVHFEASFRPE